MMSVHRLINARLRVRVVVLAILAALVCIVYGAADLWFEWLCYSTETSVVDVRMTRSRLGRFALDSRETAQLLSVVRRETSPHDGNYMPVAENVDVYLFDRDGKCFGRIWIHSTRSTQDRSQLEEIVKAASTAKEVSELKLTAEGKNLYLIERVVH